MNNTIKPSYQFLEHTADVWVRAIGNTLEQAFEQCVYGLMNTMIENNSEIEEKIIHTFEIEEESKGSLLIAFLSDFLFLFDTEYLIFHRIQIDSIKQLSSNRYVLKATGYGDEFDSSKHISDIEVKAITYSYLKIDISEIKTLIEVVYDI